MTEQHTRCWRNVSVNVKVPTIVYDTLDDRMKLGAVLAEGLKPLVLDDDGDLPDPAVIMYHMQTAALDDLRTQLAEARAERDRYIARCGELEQRLAAVRGIVK